MKRALLLLFLCCLFVSSSFAETPLPRDVGKIKLGMTSSQFFALTKNKPGVCPGDSEPEEKCTELTKDKLKKIGVHGVDTVSVAFWKGRIYFMMYGYNEPTKFNPSYYESKYGKYELSPQGTPGLVTAKWSTNNTLLMITFSERDREVVSFAIKDLSSNTEGAAW